MGTRFCRIAIVTSAGLLVALGLFTHPAGVVTAVGIAVLVVGPLTAACVYGSGPSRGVAVRFGAAAAVATAAAGVVVIGLVALLGAAAGVVIALLVVASGVWVWRHGRAWREWVLPLAASWPGHDTVRPHVPRPAAKFTPSPVRLPAVGTGPVSTAALCATWQRSYWVLLDLPLTHSDRAMVIDARRRLLDELERRDPAGFLRWMQTEPRACSDPGRYLTADTEPLPGGTS